jgi:NADPH-dependent 7-cyano-7-deazaguanine reductase QueF
MKVINLPFLISGTKITIPFCAICSVTNREFKGDIIIEYIPNEKALEFVDAELEINEITKMKLTAEELTNIVFQDVKKSTKPKYLKVLVDVKSSKAHQPVQVWIENKFE